MNDQQQRKASYDNAQKLGERVERMSKEEGWSEVFIPRIQAMRDEAQKTINKKGVDEREADHCRGVLEVTDFVLSFVEEKTKIAKVNMRKNVTAKLGAPAQS